MDIYTQVYLYYSRATSVLSEVVPASGWGSYIALDQQIAFNKSKTFLGGINYWHQFPESKGMFTSRHSSSLDIELKKFLYKKRVQISLQGSDIFRTNRLKQFSFFNGIKTYTNNYGDSRQIRIQFKYVFRNMILRREERAVGNEEERNRSN